jgi:hypothetical protein
MPSKHNKIKDLSVLDPQHRRRILQDRERHERYKEQLAAGTISTDLLKVLFAKSAIGDPRALARRSGRARCARERNARYKEGTRS